jgi:FKBP-type peptidyl-prolyl cis-trans isomerase FklB
LNLSDDQLREVAERFQKLVNNRFGERMDQKKAEGQAWLKQNLQKEGVKELAGGLQYKVLEEGDGPSPSPSDNVRVHYTGKLLNGKVFDSSVKRGEPAEFVVGQVIKGWQMALQQMQVGDKWMLYIPPELAYGERGSRPAIGPNEVLVFEVELLEIL